jgi:hypothetical protein
VSLWGRNAMLFYKVRELARKTYYVFSNTDFYLVLSFSAKKPGGNFNIVETEAVEYVRKKFAGEKGVAAADVVEKAKKTRHAPDSFAALNILYVLTATSLAKVDSRRTGNKLFFNVKN